MNRPMLLRRRHWNPMLALLVGATSLALGCGDDTGPGGGGGGGGGGGTPIGECGDGVLDAGEACDGTLLDGKTCESLGHASGTLACTAECTFDESGCVDGGTCGDGTKDAGEACDGADLGDATCVTEGFAGGVLGCTDGCALDTSQCENDAECGNAVIEAGEDCDGAALGGETCSSLGFAGGTLACADDCTFDTGACTACGDGDVDAGEACDGGNLDGQTCVSLGYDAGALACADDCTFDETGCTFLTCGNGAIDGGEECDGALLGGATCQSEGFAGGTLACAANCTFDTSACTMCGNGVVEGTEACDGADLAGQTCQSLGFASGALACSGACAFDTTGCSNVPQPGTGQLVITEIMQNPSGTDTVTGEWFELWNPSASATYQLSGCSVEGETPADAFTITSDLQIAPQGRLTLASVQNPGFTPSYVWPSGFVLTNGADTVRLVCNGTTVDEVVYDGGPLFPDPDGASMNLSPGLDATANDMGSSWCPATVASANFTSGDKGSPGMANEACPLDYTVGFCRLQFPTTITTTEGSTVTVYGRVYAAGLTDQTTGNDLAPNLIGAVGYGPDGSDPSMGGWTWTAAVPNAGWNGGAVGEPNNDEYQASLVVPAASGSPYDFAYRFSGDGGNTWVYCDGDNAGSSNGYAIADAGQLVSQPGGGPANIWINEIHYDNANNDVDEGIEIAGVAGVDLTGYSLVFYNGGGSPAGASYLTVPLTGTIPNQQNGFGTVWIAVSGIQNGAPDGVALVSPGNVVMYFLCYEGTFTASNGPAMGQACVDIGVAEEPAPGIGLSLQLTGTGGTYATFTWAAAAAHTRGAVNTGQTLQ